MLDPDDKIKRDSTWESPPRRQWIFKFFASLALLAFLVGMMLGRLFNPAAVPQYRNSVVQVQSYANGLGVCLKRAAQVQMSYQQGAYQLALLDAYAQAAQGEIMLAEQQLVRWYITPEDGFVRVVFVGLQPLRGQWSQRSSEQQWCADIQIESAVDSN